MTEGFGLCADCTHVEEDHVVDPASRVARCAQCRDEYVPTRIIRHAEDDIECPCGNRPHLDGFVCCSAIGVPQEGEYGPTPDWDGDTLACLSCKRVFSTATLAILPFYLVDWW